jgi:competence protein ComFC
MKRGIFERFFNLFFPPICLTCDEKVEKYGTLCTTCFPKLSFITNPKCSICYLPLETIYNGKTCFDCDGEKPYFNKLISLFAYDDFSHKIISDLKFNDKPNCAHYLSKLLAVKVNREFEYNIIAPVPLSKKRLKERKFNQSIIIARNIDAKNLVPNLLIKSPNVKRQTGLALNQRKQNIKNAFSLNKKYSVTGKTVLLIDDVATTYSTLNECAKVLKDAGAKKVFCATLARTPKNNYHIF